MSALPGPARRLPPRGAPRLVGRFLAVTAIGIAIAGVTIFVVVERTLAHQSERQAVDRARVTVRALLDRQLTSHDLSTSLTPARRQELLALLRRSNLGNGSRGATLYGRSGTIVSTAGRRFVEPNSPLVTKAWSGQVSSTVSTAAGGRVLRTVLPVRLDEGATGVVELDQDYKSIAAAARRTSLLAAAVLEGLLVVLCAILVPPLARTAQRVRRQVEELDWLASHDELTGLLNRKGFARRLGETLAGGNGAGGLLVLDVDGFHEINETVGPEPSDLLLREIAARISACLPAHVAARLGEDEFAVLLPGALHAELHDGAHSVVAALAEVVLVADVRVGITARVGSVRYPDDGSDPETLLRRASIALSAAREEHDRIAVYTKRLERRDVAHLALLTDFRTGLRNGDVVVHYQPQVDLVTGTLRGVEALARWQHPERGLLSAGEFIGAVERSDLVSQLGRHVLATAIEQWRSWRDDGMTVDVAVNLSALDLLDVALPGTIVDLLMERRMPADHLILEITERTLVRDEERTRNVLRQLEQIGVSLSIDDFGTGYSSLAALHTLPISQLKIDRSFVAGLPDDPDSDTIVESTIRLAHALRATVVAEGVETIEQLEWLAALGCDIAQGYLLGRPMPPEDVLTHRPARTSVASLVAARRLRSGRSAAARF